VFFEDFRSIFRTKSSVEMSTLWGQYKLFFRSRLRVIERKRCMTRNYWILACPFGWIYVSVGRNVVPHVIYWILACTFDWIYVSVSRNVIPHVIYWNLACPFGWIYVSVSRNVVPHVIT